MPSRIIGVPDKNTGYAAIHSNRHQACHSKTDFGRGDIGNNGVANDGNGQSEEHHDAPEFEAIGCKGNENCTCALAVSWANNRNRRTERYHRPVTGVATAYGITDQSWV